MDICPICSDKDLEVVMELELTPHLHHYGKITCPECGHWGRWVRKPDTDETKYRRPKNTTNLARLDYCQMCLTQRDSLPDRQVLEGHHAIESARGGDDSEANIWTLCTGCHKLLHHIRKWYRWQK